jgi:GST-like protein
MLGQHGHFALYAADKSPLQPSTLSRRGARLYGVLDQPAWQDRRPMSAGDEYTIADIALFSVDEDPQGARLHARRTIRT